MKIAADGTIYAGGTGGIMRISPSGSQTIIAGTGVLGFGGDGGPAVSARLGYVYGLALDAAGNIYFTDVYAGSRVRAAFCRHRRYRVQWRQSTRHVSVL